MIFEPDIKIVDGEISIQVDLEKIVQKFMVTCRAELGVIFERASESALASEVERYCNHWNIREADIRDGVQASMSAMVMKAVKVERDRRVKISLGEL